MTREHGRSPEGLHCPVCRVNLVMTERQNVEIDYCPQCRGVWLDRGEIDKIIERSLDQRPAPGAWGGGPARDQRGYEADRDPYEQRRPYEDRDEDRGRRGSWLSDIFGND